MAYPRVRSGRFFSAVHARVRQSHNTLSTAATLFLRKSSLFFLAELKFDVCQSRRNRRPFLIGAMEKLVSTGGPLEIFLSLALIPRCVSRGQNHNNVVFRAQLLAKDPGLALRRFRLTLFSPLLLLSLIHI